MGRLETSRRLKRIAHKTMALYVLMIVGCTTIQLEPDPSVPSTAAVDMINAMGFGQTPTFSALVAEAKIIIDGRDMETTLLGKHQADLMLKNFSQALQEAKLFKNIYVPGVEPTEQVAEVRFRRESTVEFSGGARVKAFFVGVSLFTLAPFLRSRLPGETVDRCSVTFPDRTQFDYEAKTVGAVVTPRGAPAAEEFRGAMAIETMRRLLITMSLDAGKWQSHGTPTVTALPPPTGMSR